MGGGGGGGGGYQKPPTMHHEMFCKLIAMHSKAKVLM